MSYISIALIVPNIGLIGLGLAYWRSRVADRRRTIDAQTGVECDAKRSVSLLRLVRETLFAHAAKLGDFQAQRNAERSHGDDKLRSLNEFRRINRDAADSLDADGQKLDVLLKKYGDLYKTERERIEQYTRQTRILDSHLASFSRDADGSNKVLLHLVRDLLQENSQLRGKVSTCQEQVSELIVQSVKSDREARTDSLTRLPNRRAWDEKLDTLLMDGKTSVALIDVDDFKTINDQFGHAAGDGMLNMIGTILLNSTQVAAYRIGGDEFAWIISGVSGQHEDRVAEKLRDQIAASVLNFSGERIMATVSVGIALGTKSEPIRSVLFRADQALYAAKDAGGNQVQSNLNATPVMAVGEDRAPLVEA